MHRIGKLNYININYYYNLLHKLLKIILILKIQIEIQFIL